MKSDQFFSGDHYFSPINNFTRLKLKSTKTAYNVLQSNFLEKVLNLFYHIFGILNSFSNPCTSETIYCHFLVIFKSAAQINNPLRTAHPLHTEAGQPKLVSYTDNSSEEEDLHVDANFDQPIDLTIY